MRDLLRLVRLLRPYWHWVLLGLFLSLFTVLANVGLLALSSWFIASMAIAGVAHATMDFTLPSAGVRGLALGRTGGRYLERLVNHNTTFRILARLRVWFFTRLEPLAPARLSRYRSGDLLSRIRADIDTLDDFYVRGFVPVIVAFLSVALISLFIAGYSVRLMFIDLAALAAGGVVLPLLLLLLGRRPGGERVAAAAALRAAVVDATQGAAELQALGALEGHTARMIELSAELTGAERRLYALEGGADGGIILSSGLAMWGGALLLVPLVASGTLAKADMAMLSVLMLASFESIMPLPNVFKRIGEMAAAARRLFEIIDAQPAVGDPADPVELPAGDRGVGGALPEGISLSVSGVRFRYAEGEPWILDELSFRAGAGERVAVVGRTGAGKSTLVNLLLRFWDFSEGSIMVDGVDIRRLPVDRCRALFSVVEQSPFLFHASIRDNLTVAAPESTDAQLREVLEDVQLTELLETMEQGLDTMVGESGLKLSVGQARRLSVARALLKPSPILILDEPTEGLDDATADRLLDAVEHKAKGRTVLVISHRRRDLRIADTVVKIPVSW